MEARLISRTTPAAEPSSPEEGSFRFRNEPAPPSHQEEGTMPDKPIPDAIPTPDEPPPAPAPPPDFPFMPKPAEPRSPFPAHPEPSPGSPKPSDPSSPRY